MINLIKFLKCNKTNTRISIIKECVDNLNFFKLEDSLNFDKKEISDMIIYPENVKVVEEKNIKINVRSNFIELTSLYNLFKSFSFLALNS